MMPGPADDRLLVLHALALLGHGDGDHGVAALARLPATTVGDELDRLAANGFVAEARGSLPGWVLTADGRTEHRRLLADELAATGGRDKVTTAYERFRALNQPFLTTCTDWQVRGDRPNDHADPTYDSAVVARLHDIDAAVQPVLDDLEVAVARYNSYRPRLASALARVDAGERDWFTKPSVGSYHTVWFQLHEDLLATLDLERSQEDNS